MPFFVIATLGAMFVMPHPVLVLLVPMLALGLALGLLERYIRRQALERRELAEGTETPPE